MESRIADDQLEFIVSLFRHHNPAIAANALMWLSRIDSAGLATSLDHFTWGRIAELTCDESPQVRLAALHCFTTHRLTPHGSSTPFDKSNDCYIPRGSLGGYEFEDVALARLEAALDSSSLH